MMGVGESGEIVIRGPNVTPGYENNDKANAEAFTHGWFRTGDIGELAPDGSLRLIDRKKSLFKLAQGEYVSPERVEGALGAAACVDQVWVTGDSLRAAPNAPRSGTRHSSRGPRSRPRRSRGPAAPLVDAPAT